MSIATLLNRRVREQGAAPFVTHVSDAGRTELSATTLMNAAAKIGNALLDEFDLSPGEAIGLALPPHWQRSCWLAGAWLAGIAVVPVDDPGWLPTDGVRLIVAGPREAAWLSGLHSGPLSGHPSGPLSGHPSGTRAQVAVVSLHPLGMPEAVPDGCLDATSLARIQPDAFMYAPAAADSIAVVGTDGTLDQTRVCELAELLGTRWGLSAGGRLLLDPGIPGMAGWLSMLAVPLVMQAAVVLGSADAVEREGITAVATWPLD